jgi:outer membrane protein assembly factor BamB
METAAMKTLIVLASIILSLFSLSQGKENATPRTGIVLERTTNNAFPSADIKPVVLADGRIVVGVGDTVYLLAPNGTVLWKYATAAGETLTSEPAFNSAQNEIAVVGNDLLFVRLDARTGKLKWKAEAEGRGRFSRIVAYQNGYLVVVDMFGYRENSPADNQPDRLEYWKDPEEQSWTTDFPVGAELVVDGSRIYSLSRGKDKVRLRELKIPHAHEARQ